MDRSGTAIEPGPCEVRLFDGGRLFAIERCETAEEAAAVVERWEQFDGISAMVFDLSHAAEPDEPEQPDED